MTFKEAATDLVREALDGQIPFVILRGIDQFARTEGDIDILVPRNCAEDALAHVSDLAAQDLWQIAGRSQVGYISQLCLVRRWSDEANHQAIKIDIWNGLSWGALGYDPYGAALFSILEPNGEIETAALATVLQKFLYAGFLRERDRKRIFGACDIDRILKFFTDNEIPLTRSDLEAGRLSKGARWRLRAASSGVSWENLPIWAVKVVWRTLKYRVLVSSVPGQMIVISGADLGRRTSLAKRFCTLVADTGFPAPYAQSGSTMRTQLEAFRGRSVVIDNAGAGSRQPVPADETIRSPVSIRLPQHAVQEFTESVSTPVSDDDLDRLLEACTAKILRTLRAETRQ